MCGAQSIENSVAKYASRNNFRKTYGWENKQQYHHFLKKRFKYYDQELTCAANCNMVSEIAFIPCLTYIKHSLITFRLCPDKTQLNASYKKAPVCVCEFYMCKVNSVWVCERPLWCSSRRDNDGFPHHGEVNWQTVSLGESIPYARLYTQNTHTNHIPSTDRLIAMTSRCPCTHAYNTHNDIHTHDKRMCPCGDG